MLVYGDIEATVKFDDLRQGQLFKRGNEYYIKTHDVATVEEERFKFKFNAVCVTTGYHHHFLASDRVVDCPNACIRVNGLNE